MATRTIELTKAEAYDVISGLSHVLAEAQRLEKMAFARDLPAREKRVADVRDLADRLNAMWNSFGAEAAMDGANPFQQLVKEFVPTDMPTFGRDLVVELMQLAWEQSQNATLAAVLASKKETPPSC